MKDDLLAPVYPVTPKVVFMGEKPLAAKCLEHLLTKDCEIVGVCTRKKTENVWWGKQIIREIAEKNNIPIVERKEILDLKPNIIISVLYPFVIETGILRPSKYERALNLACNLHLAPLPEYKGCNCGSHALMNGDTRFGVTLHELAPELDNGRIIAKRYFDLTLEDTSKTLYEKGCNLGYRIFEENIDSILSGNVQFHEFYDDGSKPYPRDSLKNKQIPKIENRKRVYDFVRALDFPPFEPAYFLNKKGKKIYLKAKDFGLREFELKNLEKESQLKDYLKI